MKPALIAMLMLGGVCAQAAYSQAFVSSLTGPVTQANVTAAVQAATPAPCPVPSPDTLTGSAGTGTPCMTRPDATRPTLIQATTVVTASDGSFSGSWPAPFASAPTGRIADIEIVAGSNAPYKCSFTASAVTATSFAGKCWQIVATTLPTTTTALLGLVVSPIQNAAAGLTVRVTGRQ